MSKNTTKEKKSESLSWREFWQLTKTSFKEFFKGDTRMTEGESFMHGAALAYYAILAMVPLIYLAITLFGFIVGQDKVIEIVGNIVQTNMGISDISTITGLMYDWNIGKGGTFWLRAVGLIAMILVSSALFNSLRKSLNSFLGIRTVHHYNAFLENMAKRFIYLGMIAVFGIVIIGIYFGLSLLISAGNWLFEDNSVFRGVLFPILEHLSIFLISFIGITVVFKYFHDAVVKWKMAMTGAFFTSIFMYLGQILINYYLTNFFFVPNSGIAGTLIVILVWIFYTSQIIFLGAKYMSVYARMVGSPILPKNNDKKQKKKEEEQPTT